MSTERDRAPSPPPPAGAPDASRGAASSSVRSEPMTTAQAAHLQALCVEVGEAFDSKLSKTEAGRRIESLERKKERSPTATEGGDGGSSIRANEAPPEDQTP
jgi:hypothetical protein